MKIAIPGELTSAYLALRTLQSNFEHVVVPFDEIIDAVQKGEVDAGLLIHEGQLFYNAARPAQGARSRRMVARQDRPAAADGRQRDPPRSWRTT